jgi:hypothetical protein
MIITTYITYGYMSVTAMFPVKYRHPLISLNKLYKGYWFVFTNEISFVGGNFLTINKSSLQDTGKLNLTMNIKIKTNLSRTQVNLA